MARRGSRGPKDPFAKLDSDFKDGIASMGEAEIRDRIAKITLDNAAIQEKKKDDSDLKAKLSEARDAGAVYRDAAKMNKLRIEYCRRVLGDKGKPNGDA